MDHSWNKVIRFSKNYKDDSTIRFRVEDDFTNHLIISESLKKRIKLLARFHRDRLTPAMVFGNQNTINVDYCGGLVIEELSDNHLINLILSASDDFIYTVPERRFLYDNMREIRWKGGMTQLGWWFHRSNTKWEGCILEERERNFLFHSPSSLIPSGDSAASTAQVLLITFMRGERLILKAINLTKNPLEEMIII